MQYTCISLSIEPAQWHIEYFYILQGYYRVRYGELYIFQHYTASIYYVIFFIFIIREHIATYMGALKNLMQVTLHSKIYYMITETKL